MKHSNNVDGRIGDTLISTDMAHVPSGNSDDNVCGVYLTSFVPLIDLLINDFFLHSL